MCIEVVRKRLKEEIGRMFGERKIDLLALSETKDERKG